MALGAHRAPQRTGSPISNGHTRTQNGAEFCRRPCTIVQGGGSGCAHSSTTSSATLSFSYTQPAWPSASLSRTSQPSGVQFSPGNCASPESSGDGGTARVMHQLCIGGGPNVRLYACVCATVRLSGRRRKTRQPPTTKEAQGCEIAALVCSQWARTLVATIKLSPLSMVDIIVWRCQ